MENNDCIELKLKDSVIFEDTAECITRISEMVGRKILVDYSYIRPVLRIGESVAKVGDAVCVMEDGSILTIQAFNN